MTEIEQAKAAIEKGVAEATKHFIGQPLSKKVMSEVRNACMPILLEHIAQIVDGLLNLGDEKPEFGVEIEEGGGAPGCFNIIWVAKNREAAQVLWRFGFGYYDATGKNEEKETESREKLVPHIPKEIGEGNDAWIWRANQWKPRVEVLGSHGYIEHYEGSDEYTIDGSYTAKQILNFARLIDIDPELKPPTEENGKP